MINNFIPYWGVTYIRGLKVLHLSDQQFYSLLRCNLRFDGKFSEENNRDITRVLSLTDVVVSSLPPPPAPRVLSSCTVRCNTILYCPQPCHIESNNTMAYNPDNLIFESGCWLSGLSPATGSARWHAGNRGHCHSKVVSYGCSCCSGPTAQIAVLQIGRVLGT